MAVGCTLSATVAQNNKNAPMMKKVEAVEKPQKYVVYQVFTRFVR